MVTLLRSRRSKRAAVPAPDVETAVPASEAPVAEFEIAPGDPLIDYLKEHPGPVDIDKLQIDSPALADMRETGIKLIVPLVTQGELIGTLNLGPRLSEQEYSRDDLKLLDNLAAQAAPAVRVAQLLRQQEAEARQRERLEQELKVARLIQQNFLPDDLPDLPGWDVAVYYGPAREVGGDFYDFIDLPEGRIGVVVADVTDKGVPAAMVMAAARTMLRATSQRLVDPGEVLQRVNDVLVDDIPPNMFVTCLYGVLNPESGHFTFANAGHNLPYLRTEHGAVTVRATGMPLGLMPGMGYEEQELDLGVGDGLFLCSDGIVEAHAPDEEMFGFDRLRALLSAGHHGQQLLDLLLSELDVFTGAGWEQEDDVTLVTLHRSRAAEMSAAVFSAGIAAMEDEVTLDEFVVASRPGNERIAIDRVAAAVAHLGLADATAERLKTAVAEATMNAIEHGNRNQPELPVEIRVAASSGRIVVSVTDQGGDTPPGEAPTPDLEAKLAGEQSPRGWGLFLIREMVDDVHVRSSGHQHTIDLIVHLQGDTNVGAL